LSRSLCSHCSASKFRRLNTTQLPSPPSRVTAKSILIRSFGLQAIASRGKPEGTFSRTVKTEGRTSGAHPSRSPSYGVRPWRQRHCCAMWNSRRCTSRPWELPRSPWRVSLGAPGTRSYKFFLQVGFLEQNGYHKRGDPWKEERQSGTSNPSVNRCGARFCDGVRLFPMVLNHCMITGDSHDCALLPFAMVFDLGWAQNWAQSNRGAPADPRRQTPSPPPPSECKARAPIEEKYKVFLTLKKLAPVNSLVKGVRSAKRDRRNGY
jgi:hypothetical protein